MDTEESTIQMNLQHDTKWKINYENIQKWYKISAQNDSLENVFIIPNVTI